MSKHVKLRGRRKKWFCAIGIKLSLFNLVKLLLFMNVTNYKICSSGFHLPLHMQILIFNLNLKGRSQGDYLNCKAERIPVGQNKQNKNHQE